MIKTLSSILIIYFLFSSCSSTQLKSTTKQKPIPVEKIYHKEIGKAKNLTEVVKDHFPVMNKKLFNLTKSLKEYHYFIDPQNMTDNNITMIINKVRIVCFYETHDNINYSISFYITIKNNTNTKINLFSLKSIIVLDNEPFSSEPTKIFHRIDGNSISFDNNPFYFLNFFTNKLMSEQIKNNKLKILLSYYMDNKLTYKKFELTFWRKKKTQIIKKYNAIDCEIHFVINILMVLLDKDNFQT